MCLDLIFNPKMRIIHQPEAHSFGFFDVPPLIQNKFLIR